MLDRSKTEGRACIASAATGEEGFMRKLILTLIAIAALGIAGQANAATTKDVNVYGSTFSPKSVTITEGDTIKWVNRDNSNHQVYASGGHFVSPILKPKQSWSFTFRAAGTYSYKDELHPKLTAKIIVKGLPASLTLAASQAYSTYGDKITLSGIVSNHKSGEQVSIFYQPYPSPNLIQRTVVVTTTGGAYSFIISPQILTTYQASWDGAYATPTTIQVAPKMSIGRDNGWILHASAGHLFAGRTVQFQRYNGATGQWVTLKKAILNAKSSAKIAYALPKGMNHLRLAMSVNEAGAGYLAGISTELNWVQK
jgi:plastocyanin